MARSRKKITLSASMVAPPALSLVAFLICLSAVLIPPAYYSSLMMEQDLMFLNIDVLGFFIAYWAMFLAGYFLGSRIDIARRASHVAKGWFSNVGVAFVILLLIIEIFIFIYSFNVLYHRVPQVFINFATNNVEDTKKQLMIEGTGDSFSEIVAISNGTVWWIVFRWENLMKSMTNLTKNCIFMPVLFTFMSAILSYSTLLGSRYEITPLLFGMMLIFYFKIKSNNKPISLPGKLLMFFFPFAMVGIFAFFSILRGAAGQTGVLFTLIGYGPASYNRLAAILNGSLNYDGQYGLLNEFGFLFHFPLEFRFLPEKQLFSLPEVNEISLYAKQIRIAHLTPGFTWASLFGQIYSDMGMLSFIYMFIYGAVSGLLWKLFKKENVMGILLYPWMAFSIVIWVGYDIFAYQDLAPLSLVAIFFLLFEKTYTKEQY